MLEGGDKGGTQGSQDFLIEDMAYQFEFKNTSSFYSSCKLCEKNSCKGCLVPYSAELTVVEMLDRLGLRTNDTLFHQNNMLRGKELICNINWHPSIQGELFDFLATA